MINHIVIKIAQQRLFGFDEHNDCVLECPISSAKNGLGQEFGSECTPLGSHRIRAKIGMGLQANSVLVGRRPTGEIYNSELAQKFPDRDWILSRILWLCGNQRGFNRGGNVDTQRRYIYIHGAPDNHITGVPNSHGCINMTNTDIIRLYDLVCVGTTVLIEQ